MYAICVNLTAFITRKPECYLVDNMLGHTLRKAKRCAPGQNTHTHLATQYKPAWYYISM